MEFAKYSKKYIHYYGGELPHLIKDIFDRVRIKNIVDLGCGDGAILYALSQKGYLNSLEKIIAIDISSERINNVKEVNDKICCLVADICNLDMLEDGSLDLAISNQVIEHVSDENKFIQEINRILSKNGLFYLSTIFKKSYGWYFYRCNGKWVLDPTHLREYTHENQLVELVKKYNFEILEDKKTLQWFPITDFFMKRLGANQYIYQNKFFKSLRKVKMPILGYYIWEMVLQKIDNSA